jgi:hypothetical protein
MRHRSPVTRDLRPRQLPTVTSHAVPTGECQSDPPSLLRALRCSRPRGQPTGRASPLDVLLHVRALVAPSWRPSTPAPELRLQRPDPRDIRARTFRREAAPAPPAGSASGRTRRRGGCRHPIIERASCPAGVSRCGSRRTGSSGRGRGLQCPSSSSRSSARRSFVCAAADPADLACFPAGSPARRIADWERSAAGERSLTDTGSARSPLPCRASCPAPTSSASSAIAASAGRRGVSSSTTG